MDKQQLFSMVDELEADAIKAWVDVCNIESPTSFKEGVDACSKFFIQKAEENGWKIEIHKEDVSGDAVCITMNPEAEGKPVAISGHLDTVHPVGLFGNPPTRIENGKIYGPGVTDCKGGVVASFYAMQALHNCGFNDRPVMLILQSDEEVSSRFSQLRTIDFMCEKAKDAVAFLNTEGCSGTNGVNDNLAILLRKGIVRYNLTVKGKSVHSCRSFDGANAVLEAAHKIIELEKYKDTKWGITSNCGIINGGSAANTVPEECTVTVDFRLPDKAALDEIEAFVKEVAETSHIAGTTCEVVRISHRPAMVQSELNVKLLEKINEIYSDCELPVLEAGSSRGGSDAAYTTNAGIPTVDNLGVLGDRIHSADEHAYLFSMKESILRIATVAAFIKE